MKDRLDGFWSKDGTRTVLASLASIIIGLLVGCVVILVVGYTSGNLSPKSAWEGVRIVLANIFSTGRTDGVLTFGFNPVSTGNMLFRATPLIMTGLSVAVAFKTGLFNIGAPGQYLMGTMASLMLALSIPSDVIHPVIIWFIAFLGGMAAGALWGCIPGLVKAYLNINEVLASIMTNWIAANVVTWAFENSNFRNMVENTKSGYVYKTTYNGVETAKLGLDKIFPGSQVNGGIVVAVLIAILMYIVINKTTLGYQLKACGSNRHAARYAGIKDKRNIVLSMAIAGALAGGGAALYYLSGNTEFYWSTYQSLPATGFNGIPVALLAANSPLGVIFTGIFMSMLDIAGQQLTSLTPYNEYLTDVIIAVIVYLSAFSLVIKMLITGKKKRRQLESIPKLGYEPGEKKAADAAETQKGGEAE
jgi:simple sugar transport system permease protein